MAILPYFVSFVMEEMKVIRVNILYMWVCPVCVCVCVSFCVFWCVFLYLGVYVVRFSEKEKNQKLFWATLILVQLGLGEQTKKRNQNPSRGKNINMLITCPPCIFEKK